MLMSNIKHSVEYIEMLQDEMFLSMWITILVSAIEEKIASINILMYNMYNVMSFVVSRIMYVAYTSIGS